jgi:hypothetical protein
MMVFFVCGEGEGVFFERNYSSVDVQKYLIDLDVIVLLLCRAVRETLLSQLNVLYHSVAGGDSIGPGVGPSRLPKIGSTEEQ